MHNSDWEKKRIDCGDFTTLQMLVYNRSHKMIGKRQQKRETKGKKQNRTTKERVGLSESISAEDTLLGPHSTPAQELQGFLPEDA
jgi:hypothetical protein